MGDGATTGKRGRFCPRARQNEAHAGYGKPSLKRRRWPIWLAGVFAHLSQNPSA